MNQLVLDFPKENIDDFAFFEATSEIGPPLMIKYSSYLLLDAFHGMDIFRHAGEKYTLGGLKDKIALISEYERLLMALLDILVREGFLLYADGEWTATNKADDPQVLADISSYKATGGDSLTDNEAIKQYMSAYLKLLNVCFPEYANILSGKKRYMDVMFPMGNLSLISGIYKSNIQSLYNNLLTNLIEQTVAGLLEAAGEEKIHILEVGAGTGGASIPVLNRLSRYADRITYWFTDIAGGFTRIARRDFGDQYPFIEYKILNINQDPGTQGFEGNHYSMVICTNVLHATSNINNTIANLAFLLKAGGWLVINDLTLRSDFNTCTFGLTKDWWNFEDADLRIEHSPLLTVARWNELLEAGGFDPITLVINPDLPLRETYQSIIPAVKRR
jgi:SAM-dependent methyltransferase